MKSATYQKAGVERPLCWFEIDPGDITSKANKLIGFQSTVVTVLPTDLTFPNVAYKLYGGDVNNNSSINAFDISALLDDFGKTEGLLHPGSDVNLNGSVNVFDISALLDGFGKSNE